MDIKNEVETKDLSAQLNFSENLNAFVGEMSSADSIKSFIEQHDRLALHLGCGPRLISGWLNIDLHSPADLKLDLSEKLIFADNSVDNIYSQHFLEHLELYEAKRLLAECYRVLKPSATARICVPDVSALLSIVSDKNWKERRIEWTNKDDFVSNIELLNYGMYHLCKHKYMYSYEELKRISLEVAPWSRIIKCKDSESQDPQLRNLETRFASNLIIELTK